MTNKPDSRSIPVRQDIVMPEIARMYRELESERDELRAEVERHCGRCGMPVGTPAGEMCAEIERLRTLIVGLLHADEDAIEQARALVGHD